MIQIEANIPCVEPPHWAILEHARLGWEGITAQFARYDCGQGHPMVVKEYEQGYDWMHQGEGYLFFYLLCLADPTDQVQIERAKRYAGFFLNEERIGMIRAHLWIV